MTVKEETLASGWFKCYYKYLLDIIELQSKYITKLEEVIRNRG